MRLVVIASLCAVGAFSLPLTGVGDKYEDSSYVSAKIQGGQPVVAHSLPYQSYKWKNMLGSMPKDEWYSFSGQIMEHPGFQHVGPDEVGAWYSMMLDRPITPNTELLASRGPIGRRGVFIITMQAAIFATTSDGVTGFCGGALINAQHVLTAAHCMRVQDDAPATIIVALGVHSIYSTSELNRVTVLAETVIVHPQYDAETLRNDLAVIRLVSAIGITASIAPVKLPEFGFSGLSLPGRLAVASGWGIVANLIDFVVPELRSVTTRVTSIEHCNLMYGNTLADTTMCTFNIGSGTCTGDNGGPLTVVINTEVTLVGITTLTRDDCETAIPSIYTDLSTSLSWIKTTAGILDIQN